jgi:hypothetical protein
MGTVERKYFRTSSKKSGRGRAQASIELIAAMHDIAEETQPITGRGIGYKLFTKGLTPDMTTRTMAGVYRLLKQAREEGIIPWEWIVDETREMERIPSWSDPADYVRSVRRSYRRDFWNQQAVRIVVWSEKGTVRGVLRPVLDDYGVGFMALHGFNSATAVHQVCCDDDGRPLLVIYVGDYDPSGMCMSEVDLPKRIEKYGGTQIDLRRLTLCRGQMSGLPSFPASEKKNDKRYEWFVRNYGKKCWELDAMDPRDLRDMVEEAIRAEIDWEIWDRCTVVQEAESESLKHVLDAWTNQHPTTD